MANVDSESGTKFCDLEKFRTQALVDSGADISLVSLKTLKKNKPEFIVQNHAPQVQLKGVTGLGNKYLTHECHAVQDLCKNVILGIDSMETHKATVDFGRKT